MNDCRKISPSAIRVLVEMLISNCTLSPTHGMSTRSQGVVPLSQPHATRYDEFNAILAESSQCIFQSQGSNVHDFSPSSSQIQLPPVKAKMR